MAQDSRASLEAQAEAVRQEMLAFVAAGWSVLDVGAVEKLGDYVARLLTLSSRAKDEADMAEAAVDRHGGAPPKSAPDVESTDSPKAKA